jgi:hypothetical protein
MSLNIESCPGWAKLPCFWVTTTRKVKLIEKMTNSHLDMCIEFMSDLITQNRLHPEILRYYQNKLAELRNEKEKR